MFSCGGKSKSFAYLNVPGIQSISMPSSNPFSYRKHIRNHTCHKPRFMTTLLGGGYQTPFGPPTKSICLNLAEKQSRPNQGLSTWARKAWHKYYQERHYVKKERILAYWLCNSTLFLWGIECMPSEMTSQKSFTELDMGTETSWFTSVCPESKTVPKIEQMLKCLIIA